MPNVMAHPSIGDELALEAAFFAKFEEEEEGEWDNTDREEGWDDEDDLDDEDEWDDEDDWDEDDDEWDDEDEGWEDEGGDEEF